MISKQASNTTNRKADTKQIVDRHSSHTENYQRTTEILTTEKFIKREQALSDITLREKAVKFLFITFGSVLICTVTVIILQGFHLGGFNLELEFLRWLGVATVGEIATLLTIALSSLFKKK